MKISTELSQAIEEAQEQALAAVSHVGAANYAEREREAKQWVRDAFEKLEKEIEQEPQRSKLAEWRKAVAEGKTLFGFPEWCRQVQ